MSVKTTVKKMINDALAKGEPVDKKMTADPKKEGVPVFLQAQNRRDLTPEQKKKVEEDTKKANAVAQVYDPSRFDKPKGMSDEDYDAWKNRERLAKEEKKKERLDALKLRQPVKEKKEMPANSFTLRQWAKDNKIDPRHARAAARANKDKLKVLEHGGKYIYPNKVMDQVAKIIQDGVKSKGSPKKEKVSKKIEPSKIQPGGVFTGKAKVNRQKKQEPVEGEKAKLKKSIKPLVKKKLKK